MLVSLELFGFKSFAERTKFDFAEGLTCVVGPNGSGKSNVVDSIKWILGDQSPKSLRGGEMMDVIFNGSKSAKPSGFAEALLTFNNEKHLINLDAELIVIGRRLYRSGDSEYLLNGQVVRLKDIRDLLMGTGCGLSSYNIIEQGRVGQILQSNPTARRQIFEEAAGISKYKLKKGDALKKLEHVSQNLLRLKDIVDEVGNQLQTSRNQASKAAKYREFHQELLLWSTGLAIDDDEYYQSRTAELNLDLTGLRDKVSQARQKYDQLQELTQQRETELQFIEEENRKLQKEISSRKQQLAESQAGMRFQRERLEELQAEQKRIYKQREEWEVQRASLQSRLEQTSLKMDEGRDSIRLSTQRLEQCEQELKLVDVEIELKRTELRGLEDQSRVISQEISQLQGEALRWESQLAAHQQNLQRLQERASELHIQLSIALEEKQQQQEKLEVARQESFGHEKTFQHSQKKLEKAQQEFRKLQQQLADLKEQRSAAIARKRVLEDQELKQEGLGLSTREILKLAQAATTPPWNGVLGTITDFIEVDLEHAGIIDRVLGFNAQSIVVHNLQELLENLEDEALSFQGRVQFIDLKTAGSKTHPSNLADEMDNLPTKLKRRVISPALNLLRFNHEGARQILEYLLADTWVVEDMTTAWQIRQLIHSPCRFVTLTGELLDERGVLIVGQEQGELGLVSRRTELRQLRQDILQGQELITQQEQKTESQHQVIAQCEQALIECQAKLQTESQTLATFEAQYQAAVTEYQKHQLAVSKLTDEQNELANIIQKAASETAEKQSLVHSRQLELTSIKERLEQQHLLIENALEQRLHQQSTRQSLAEQCNSYRQEQGHLKQAIDQLQQNILQYDQQLDKLNAQLNSMTERRSTIERQFLNYRAQGDEHIWGLEQQEAHWVIQYRQQLRLRDERQQVMQQERLLQQALRQDEDSLRSREFELHELEIKHQAQLEKLREDFQLELQEVLATGKSALTLWVEQRPVKQDTQHSAINTDLTAAQELQQVRTEIVEHIEKLRRKIKALGQVNTESLEVLDELEGRFHKLSSQLSDLTEAKNTLESIISRMDEEMKRLFLKTYEEVRGYFQVLFRKCFGGGEGDIVLEDPENILDCGLEIVARPPGKQLRSISLMSGGEKTMTAVGLLLALFRHKPSPFCILDECDAALDEANIDRYVAVLNEFKSETQFIMITHRKRSMVAADRIYGVTMEQAGISKRLSVKFEEVAEDGHISKSHAA